jgi:hypothetical protein
MKEVGMSSHPPPVPPAGRTDKGSGSPRLHEAEKSATTKPDKARDPKQGRQGSVKQNTTHPGFQQDR